MASIKRLGWAACLALAPAAIGQITISPDSLPNGSIGTPYTAQLSVNAQGSYTFTVASGNLPPGLGLSGQGLISGTPNQSGTYNFVAMASLPLGTNGSARKAYALFVQGAPGTIDNQSPLPDA